MHHTSWMPNTAILHEIKASSIKGIYMAVSVGIALYQLNSAGYTCVNQYQFWHSVYLLTLVVFIKSVFHKLISFLVYHC